MAVAAGTRLGPFEITAPLGAGGMGKVYRARDTRLSRDVVLKDSPSTCSLFYRGGRASECLWKVSVHGGEPVQLTDKPSTRGFFSPDGKLIASGYFIEGAKPPWKIAIIPVEGGPPVKIFDQPETPGALNGGWWTSGSRELVYQGQQSGIPFDNIWRQPIDGGKPQQITSFTSDVIYNFALSRDGKKIALSRGLSVTDVVLIKDFR